MEYENFTYENIHNETNIRRKELNREREENIKRITEKYIKTKNNIDNIKKEC